MSLQDEQPALRPQTVGSLVAWGLSADADLVYRALFASGPQLRGTLSRALGMAPLRVSAALDELVSVNAALVIPQQRLGSRQDARLWAATLPDVVVPRLRRRHDVPTPWERVRRHTAIVSRLDLPAWPAGSRTPPRILSGLDLVRSRVTELVATERHEHLAMNPEPAFDAATVRIASPLDRSLRARGVALRTLGVPAADGNAAADHELAMARLGVQHRIADTLPLKLMIFDHQTALLPLDPLDPARGAIEVSDTDIVQTLVAIYREQWDAARPPAVTGHLGMKLTPRECAIVELLAAGHTDSTTAMRTRTSLRTVRYTLRGLMDRLEVENRFQLGLALGRHGVRPARTPANPAPDKETS